MNKPLHVALIWPMHQPQYKDPLTGVYTALVQWSEAAQRADVGAVCRRAWEHLYAAEGSDWYWWYFQANQVEGKNPYHDLFLRHLQAVYRIAGASEFGEIGAFARADASVDCFG